MAFGADSIIIFLTNQNRCINKRKHPIESTYIYTIMKNIHKRWFVPLSMWVVLLVFVFNSENVTAQTHTFSSTDPAVAAAIVPLGGTKIPIYKIEMVIDNYGANIVSVTFTPTGTFQASDIVRYNVYTNTSDDLSTATKQGADGTPATSGSPVTINTWNQWLPSTTYYLWITMDITSNSSAQSHTLTVGALTTADITLNNGTNTGTMYAGGTQTFGSSSPAGSLSVSPSSLTGLDYIIGAGPSDPKYVTITGSNLDGTAVTATAPTNYEISTSPSGTYAASINLGTATTLDTTVYVRLQSGLNPNGAYTGNLTVSGGGAASKTVSLSGRVSSGTTCSNGIVAVKEDFGSGTNPGDSLTYVTGLIYQAADCPNDGYYTVRNRSDNCFSDAWLTIPEDHTPDDTDGYMLMVNAPQNAGADFFVMKIDDLCPGTTFFFSAWMLNPHKDPNNTLPVINFEIYQADSTTLIASYSSGSIPLAENSSDWEEYDMDFTVPTGQTSVVLKMSSQAQGGNGSDIFIDDIQLRACGPVLAISAPDTVCTGLAASLVGTVVSGAYTNPVYQWRRSTDGGETWTDIQGATALTCSQVETTAGTYLYRLLSAESGNITNSKCRMASPEVTVVFSNGACKIKACNDINQVPANTTAQGNVKNNDRSDRPTTVSGAKYYDNTGELVSVILGEAAEIYTKDGTKAGSLTINTNGTYTFVPAGGFAGTVEAEYSITDEYENTSTAQLFVNVVPNTSPSANNPPVANNDTYTAEHGKAAQINILANDSDPDGDTVTVTEVKAVTSSGGTVPSAISTDSNSPSDIYVGTVKAGTAYVDASGNIMFTPDAGFTGDVPFSYTISDGNGGTASAGAVVTVVPANASNNVYSNDDAKTTFNTSVSGNILANDLIEGTRGTLTVKGTVVSSPGTGITLTEGTLTFSPDGSYTFTPASGFVGTAAVPYSVCNTETPAACDNAVLYLTNLDSSVKYWIGTQSDNFNTDGNWTNGKAPGHGDDVIFATNENNDGNPAVRNMVIPAGTDITVGNLSNATNYASVVSAGASLTITGTVSGSDSNPSKLVVKAGAAGQHGGSLIVEDGCNKGILGTVEFLAIGVESDPGSWTDNIAGSPDLNNTFTTKYKWQHFGIPVKEITHAIDYFENAYVREYDETYNGDNRHFYQKWYNLSTWSKLEAFKGYEITHDADGFPSGGKLYEFKGELNFCDTTLTMTRRAPAVSGASGVNEHYGLGQNIFGNSYTSAIRISAMNIPDMVEKTVYLYNTGRFYDWANSGTVVGNEGQLQAGNYLAIPQNASPAVWDGQIPSMQGFLLRFTGDSTIYNRPDAKVTLSYGTDALTPNTKRLLAPRQQVSAPLQKETARERISAQELSYLRISLESRSTADDLWLFSREGTTPGWDNGWDGRKSFGTPTAFIYAETEAGPMQVSASRTIDGTPVTFRGDGGGHYTLTLAKSNLGQYGDLHLIDLAERSAVPLTEDTTRYEFYSANKGTAEKRFLIVNRPVSRIDPADAGISLLEGRAAPDGTLEAVNYTGHGGTICLYSVSGSLVFSGEMEPGANRFRVSVSPGAYIMRLEAGGAVKSVKVIISRQPKF